MSEPILLVHGIHDTGARFDKMRKHLQSRGFSRVHAMNMTPSDASISLEAMAEQVRVAACSLRESTGSRQIDIVAFSMGSLAARYAMREMGAAQPVRRFVSISGPHHGTLTAYLSRKDGARQMRPGSGFLNDLNELDISEGGLQVHSLWSPFDLMVIPATSSLLPGAHNHAFRVALHHQMLTDRRVIEAVTRILGASDNPN